MPGDSPPLPDWPRAFGEPLLSAEVRAQPADFRVFEQLGFEPDDDGEHDLLLLEKSDANTRWLAGRLARHAGVAERDVGYCGLKDRRAITCQWFSVRRPNRDGTDWGSFSAEGIRLIEQRRHGRKLRPGSHAGNRFIITARCDSPPPADDIEQRCQQIRRRGLANYFGEQRFGRDAGNLRLAHRLFDGARLKRGDRQFALSAARAWLFNKILAQRVRDDNWSRAVSGDVIGLDGSHSVFPSVAGDSELSRRLDELDVHIVASLWGRGSPVSSDEAAELERAALRDDDAFCSGLERSGVDGDHRQLRVRVPTLDVTVKGTTAEFAFSLPPGSFATALLREFIGS